MERCPLCRAMLHGADTCRRCRAELSSAQRVARESRRLVGGICQRSRRTCRREVNAEFCLRRPENGERTGGATEVNEATAAGGNMLVVAGVGAEEVTEFVVASTEPLR